MDKRILGRLVALGLLVVLFYSQDWMFLRRLLTNAAGAALTRMGHTTTVGQDAGDLLLTVDGQVYGISPDCTYIDLVLIITPFWWRVGRGIRVNVLRLLVLAFAILAGNVFRVVFGMHFIAQGTSWFLAHDLPDMLIYWPSLAVAVILSIRHDLRERLISNSTAGNPTAECIISEA